ncbi:MAG: transcriptional regulator, partial [Betaproteobacteria bacterium]|nr:transcriptional regulator [Betaproteobacteria bacterium]
QFPNRPPVVIEHLGAEPVARKKLNISPRRARAAA